MIPRYSRPEMARIWEPETRFRIWLENETYAAEAMAKLGLIPKHAADAVKRRGGFDVARIEEIEREVKHDVIAFLTSVAEHVGPEARFLHAGLTSSDVLDTCFNVQLVQAADILIADVEFSRARARLVRAREEVATCAISGAVGTFAHVDPRVEEFVAKKLGLKVEPISTQVVPRDRHAAYFAALALVASSLERLAIEIRHLQRTEVLEAEEYFSPGQKGSSAMPHKRNPVLSENITGLARLVRGFVTPAMENVALWHERDISHSSVERMAAPDATVTLDFALNRLIGLVDKLLIYPENMKKNLDKLGGLHNSQRVLLALVEKGATREDAYRMVQRNAMKVWKDANRKEGDFLRNLENDADVAKLLSKKELSEFFDLDYHFTAVDVIFERVFGQK